MWIKLNIKTCINATSNNVHSFSTNVADDLDIVCTLRMTENTDYMFLLLSRLYE